jgi:hypothetical protein
VDPPGFHPDGMWRAVAPGLQLVHFLVSDARAVQATG